jgi:RHS repeat-associated protein
VLANTYDALGRLVKESSSDGTIGYLYAYDKVGNLIQTSSIDGEVTRTYDGRGNLKEETLPSGLRVKYTYDVEGRKKTFSLKEHTISYDYDAFNLKKVSRQKQGRTLYAHEYLSYDLSGRVLLEELPLSTGQVFRDYDLLGRGVLLQSPYFTQEALSFDPVGNLLLTKRQKKRLAYTYDELYQITSEKGHQYTFDALYNRVEKDGVDYSINLLNQTDELVYDADGNPTFFKDKKLSYDALDRIILVESALEQIHYSYDSFHRRLSKKTYQKGEIIEEVYFLYDGQNEIGFCDKEGSLLELRILGDAVNAEIGSAIALEIKGEVYIPFHDLHGSMAAVYAPKSHTLEDYSYTAFGEEQFANPLSPWRFSSKRTDAETGFVYYGRRYYLPVMGRWLTQDPLGHKAGPNLYAFVSNAPLTHFDLYGLEETGFSQNTINFMKGTGHGIADFAVSSLHGLEWFAACIGTSSLDIPLEERECVMESIASSQANRGSALSATIMDRLSIDPTDRFYKSSRAGTVIVLNIASFVPLGVGAIGSGVKAASYGMKASRLAAKAGTKSASALAKVPKGVGNKYSLDALSNAGKVPDRGGLTRAGRALDKHGGNRPGKSPFPQGKGNEFARNNQGQFHLDDILTHPNSKTIDYGAKGFEIYAPDGRGVHFRMDGSFRGFVE